MEETKKTRKTIPRWKALLACFLCLVLGATAAVGGIWAAIGEDGRVLLQAQRLIDHRFVGEYDQDLQRQTTLKAMVDGLGDRWSYYLTPSQYQSTLAARANQYVGVGVTVSREDPNDLVILEVTPGGPAEEAGVQAGDIIRAVDGTDLTPENREDCIAAIRGEEGTTVVLTLQGTDGTTREVTVERRTIQEVSAHWVLTQDGVGLITIYNFYTGAADSVTQGVEELQAQGAKALILDVRYNPGGYVHELVDILDLLLPQGDVFISRKYNGEETVYTSDEDFVDLPLAVLVNEESYSAAEFLAAQLREGADALVVGTRTCGKGYSQMLYELSDGSAIGLSTARYFTGSGVSLIGSGVEPDPVVELSEEANTRLLNGDLPLEEDLQYQAAVRALVP
ncbi:MAG: S41 family peptidase [Ruminiclostridium sp.]|nr:S41 family peptidase [Ruminiclostridium sp.]